ncbi:SET domain-containing protein [Meredithblackwellia eburnea MCA 4105]
MAQDWRSLKQKRESGSPFAKRNPPPLPGILPSTSVLIEQAGEEQGQDGKGKVKAADGAEAEDHQHHHSPSCGHPGHGPRRPSPDYEDLPQSLSIECRPNRGRGAFAFNAIPAGTTIISTKPMISVLDSKHLAQYCSFCFRSPSETNTPSRHLLQCARCKTIKYCSLECQKADWAAHKPECAALRSAGASDSDKKLPGAPVRALGRLVWLLAKEKGSFTEKQIHALQSHRADLAEKQKEELALLSMHLGAYVGSEALAAAGLQSGEGMLDLCSRFISNSFALTTPYLTPVGVSISPLVALFNHSCFPNAVVVFPSYPSATSPSPLARKHMKVVAIRKIELGEEVVTSYVDLTEPGDKRREELAERYFFECDCYLCGLEKDKDWPDPRKALWCSACKAKVKFPNEDGVIKCHDCGKREVVDQKTLVNALEEARETLQHAISIQDTSSPYLHIFAVLSATNAYVLCSLEPIQAINMLVRIVKTLTISHHFGPPCAPKLAVYQTLFPLEVANAAHARQPSSTIGLDSIQTLHTSLGLLFPYPHPVRAIAHASLIKLKIASLHPEDEASFWKDRTEVGKLMKELGQCIAEVEGVFGKGVVGSELRALMETLEEGWMRTAGGRGR